MPATLSDPFAPKGMQAKDVSVTEAAFECGFNDSSYFARQFRRVVGVSPREFMDGRRVRGEAGEV